MDNVLCSSESNIEKENDNREFKYGEMNHVTLEDVQYINSHIKNLIQHLSFKMISATLIVGH